MKFVLSKRAVRVVLVLASALCMISFQNCGSTFKSSSLSNTDSSLSGFSSAPATATPSPASPAPADPVTGGVVNTSQFKTVSGFTNAIHLMNRICNIDQAGGVSCMGCIFQVLPGATYPSCTQVTHLQKLNLNFSVKTMTEGCYLTTDSKIYCYGYNSQGQAGVDPAVAQYVQEPTEVLGLGGVPISLVSTSATSCALLQTGVVKCWGLNIDVPAVNGQTTSSYLPKQIAGLSSVKAIYSTLNSSQICAWQADQSLMCWGKKIDDESVYYSAPVLALQSANIRNVATGALDVFCVLLDSGVVTCYKDKSAAGAFNFEAKSLSNIIDLASTSRGLCARSSAGDVSCWGYNMFGRLGAVYIHNEHILNPMLVPEWKGAVSMAIGMYSTCAIMPDTTAKCIGYNNLDLNDYARYETQASDMGLTEPVVSVKSFEYNGTCVKTLSGLVKCFRPIRQWENYNLASTFVQKINSIYTSQFFQVPAANIETLVHSFSTSALSTAVSEGCYIDANAKVKCWGSNSVGQLGNGTLTASASPVEVLNLSQVVQLKNYSQTYCALTALGKVFCWGGYDPNVFGSLNLATVDPVKTPVELTYLNQFVVDFDIYYTGLTVHGADGSLFNPTSTFYNLSNVKKYDYKSFCAILNDNSLTCYLPATASNPVGYQTVLTAAVGTMQTYMSCFLMADKTLKCWGDNTNGQLGQGDSNVYAAAVTVKNLTNVSFAFSYKGFNCAYTDENLGAFSKVKCWGKSYYGENSNLGVFEMPELQGYRPIISDTSGQPSNFLSTTGQLKTTSVARISSVPYLLVEKK